MVADARKFFDGKGAPDGAQAFGRYFTVAPFDDWFCGCPACQAQFTLDRNNQEFTNGVASDYWFAFVNKVAREIAKTHPNKYLSTYAYSDYAYYPRKVHLEPNVSVEMCLQARHWWAPGSKATDARVYRGWVSHEKGRPLYVRLYCCFPELLCDRPQPWHCFHGFSAHYLDQQIKMFARDGIRGVYLDGVGEQVDLYVLLKLLLLLRW